MKWNPIHVTIISQLLEKEYIHTTLTTCGASDPARIIYGWDLEVINEKLNNIYSSSSNNELYIYSYQYQGHARDEQQLISSTKKKGSFGLGEKDYSV